MTGPLLITTFPKDQFWTDVTGHFPGQPIRMGNLLGCLIVLMAGRIPLRPSLKLSPFNMSLLCLVFPHPEPGPNSPQAAHVCWKRGWNVPLLPGRCSRPLAVFAALTAVTQCSCTGKGKPKAVFQAWSDECCAEDMIPSHKLLSLCAFPEAGCKTHLFPMMQVVPVTSISKIFQGKRTLSETWDAEKLFPETCLTKICPTLLKLFQLQATFERCSWVLHPAHGYILPHPSLSHCLGCSIRSVHLNDSR